MRERRKQKEKIKKNRERLDTNNWEVYIKNYCPCLRLYHNIVLDVVNESSQVEGPLTFFAFLLIKWLKIREFINLIGI
jgi:hypothetical protein